MAGITLAQATAKLTLWMAADDALTTSQKYRKPSANGEAIELTRADAGMVRENVKYWNQQVVELSGGGMSARGITPFVR